VPHDSSDPDVRRRIDLATALEYGTAEGYPPLLNFIREFTRTNLHPNVPYKGGPDVVLTCGNTDGFSKVIQALSNEWFPGENLNEVREGLLVEEYCYMNAVQTARPRGLNIVPVKMDDEGMIPFGEGGLKDVLENWDFAKGKRPHLLYTVT
jgi:DNA-binding transcriptional MocR family regulator